MARSALCLRSRSDAVAKPQLPRIGETLARRTWRVRHAALDWPQLGFGFGHDREATDGYERLHTTLNVFNGCSPTRAARLGTPRRRPGPCLRADCAAPAHDPG